MLIILGILLTMVDDPGVKIVGFMLIVMGGLND